MKNRLKRYVIIENGRVVDDCNGWGYKTEATAEKGYKMRLVNNQLISISVQDYNRDIAKAKASRKRQWHEWMRKQKQDEENWKPTKRTRIRPNYKI